METTNTARKLKNVETVQTYPYQVPLPSKYDARALWKATLKGRSLEETVSLHLERYLSPKSCPSNKDKSQMAGKIDKQDVAESTRKSGRPIQPETKAPATKRRALEMDTLASHSRPKKPKATARGKEPWKELRVEDIESFSKGRDGGEGRRRTLSTKSQEEARARKNGY